MQKTLTASLIMMAVFLITGSWLFPEHASLWLADTDTSMNIMRGILIGLLVGLLLTEPPRGVVFRCILGGGAMVLGLLTLSQAYTNLLMPLDALMYTLGAILFGIAALEEPYFELQQKET